MALNRSDKSRILRRYFPGMTRNSEMSTEPKALVQERVGNFLAGLASRGNEVRRRCRTVLQSRAEALLPNSQADSPPQANAHPTLALV